MSLKKTCPCDIDGICPYDDCHSGFFGSCEFWCGADEPEDTPEEYEPEDYL